MMNIRKKGFTLIELMLVIGIVAILVAFAIPSFQDALRKSRRSDAMNTIMDIQLAQEKYRTNNARYGTNAQLGFDNPQITPDGHYSVAVSLPFATAARSSSYAITATALNDQANDYCGNFVLTNALGVITKTNPGSAAASNPELCWRK
jgi:type IV pilus assembly protein PilE